MEPGDGFRRYRVAGGLAAAYIINLIIPTTNLGWSLIAVGFAAFFSGVFGYLGGVKQQSR